MTALPFRIKIGITGHRENIPDNTALKNKIREVLGIDEWNKYKTVAANSVFSLFDKESIKQLRKLRNTPITFSIMTALAEGVDRIAAEAVLEIKGSKIEAILPLTREEYLEDFDSVESKKEFVELLARDHFAVSLRNKRIKDEYPEADIQVMKNKAYGNAGKYIVDHCDVMISVWDSDRVPGNGGTYDAKKYAEKIKRPLINIDPKNIKNVNTNAGYFIHAVSIWQIDRFNSYILSDKKSDDDVDSVTNLFADYFINPNLQNSEPMQFNPDWKDIIKQKHLPYFSMADLLANKYKRKFLWTGQFSYTCSTLAVILLLISLVFKIYETEAYIIEFFLLLIIFTIITLAHHWRVHSSWLEFRFLAERIRAVPFFFLIGRDITGISVSSLSCPKPQKSQWVFLAFSEIWHQLLNEYYNYFGRIRNEQPFSPQLLSYVRKALIAPQLRTHQDKLRINNLINKFLEVGGRLIFIIAILSALAHIILFNLTSFDEDYKHLFHNILTIMALSLPIIAAAFEGVRRQGEYSRNKNRQEGMIHALEAIDLKFKDAKSGQEFFRLMEELDQLLLSDNKEWMVMMQPVDLEYIT